MQLQWIENQIKSIILASGTSDRDKLVICKDI